MPTLPDVKGKFVIDYSDLSKAEKASAKAHREFQSGAKASTTSVKSLTSEIGGLGSQLGIHLPASVSRSATALEGLESSGTGAGAGIGLAGGVAIAAAAGLGLLAEGAHLALDSYVGLADKVENYRRVVGGSAEESSRQVEAFQMLGVSGDTATAAMFKLSKAAETSEATLAALGVTVVRDKAGNVDLSKTLGSVADAYNATADQAKKNLILFDAFGKSGKDMIPILEQGSAGLARLESQASMVFSADDLQRAKDYKIQLQQSQQQWDSFVQTLGQAVLPVLGGVLSAQNEAASVQRDYNKAIDDGTISQTDAAFAGLGLNNAADKLYAKLRAQYEAGMAASNALSQLSASAQQAADDEAALTTELDKATSAAKAQADAGYALTLADLTVKESQDAITTAQLAYTKAVRDYGANSIEARKAADDVVRATEAQYKAYIDAGYAAEQLQKDTDKLSGASGGAALESQALLDKLQAEADSLAPDSPLRVRLQEYIDKLDRTGGVRNTRFTQTFTDSGRQGGTQHFAAGGRPPVGVPSWVGEGGRELFVPDVPGTIVAHGQAGGALPAGSSSTYNVSVNVAGSVQTERSLLFAIREGIRRIDREHR